MKSAFSGFCMRSMLAYRVHRVIRHLGYELRRPTAGLRPPEVDLYSRVRPYTATTPERVVGLIDAVKYVTKNGIPGSIVECGVWRGGSVMTIAWTLLELGDTSRDIYLYDTFEGMSEPSDKDRLHDGTPVAQTLATLDRKEEGNLWAFAPLDAVKRNVLSTGYPAERIHFVQGKVEDTLPAQAPERIALLRLDTDWYESTRHELVHLYPRLSAQGVLIIDDYGDWQGARQAVDEYFAGQPYTPLLTRMDTTGRMAIKAAPG
jgi:O-methyltransferase